MGVLSILLGGFAAPVFANPVDGNVAAGSAQIISAGTKTDIIQSTDKAVIDWRSFDVQSHEQTEFHQPTANSMTLNRVNDTKASSINGVVKANGKIFIINQNGILFGKEARVDVNGLVATSADIDNSKFMAGNLQFDKPGKPDATIENRGTITAKDAGLVGLVAPNVINRGVINARLGRVHLASGDRATVDMYGDGLLEVTVSDAVTSQLVDNSGTIRAEGGTIALTAAAGRQMVNSLITVSGELSAPAVGTKNGKIIIAAEGSNAVAGNDAAVKGKKTGTSTVLISGKIDVSNAAGKGGSVEITADHIGVLSGAQINATGATDGGSIHIGGQYLGQGATPTALVSIVQTGVLLDASSSGTKGAGGEVIIYADNRTEFGGSIRVDGGSQEGDGGFVETSGRVAVLAYGNVSALSRRGRKGTWLLDPADIEITANTNANNSGAPNFTATNTVSQVSAVTIKNSLDNNVDVTIATSNDGYAGSGDITVNSAISTTGSGALTLSAYRNIAVNQSIALQGGALMLRANNADVGSGSIYVAANITTAGGNITMGGGSGIISEGVGFAIGNAASTAINTTVTGYGIGLLGSATVNAGGGSVIMNGQGYADGASGSNVGILLWGFGGGVRTTGSGTVALTGIGGGTSGNNSNNIGVYIYNGDSVSAVNGNVTVTGTGGGAGTGSGNSGVNLIFSGSSIKTSGAGSIIINATGGLGTGGSNQGLATTFSANTVQTSGAGSIIVNGVKGQGASYGIYANTTNAIATTGTGNITLMTDTISLNATTTVNSIGKLTIAPYSNIGVSVGTDVSGTLNISNTTLGYIGAGSYVFGSTTTAAGAANTGDLTIATTSSFGGLSAQFISGNDINIADNILRNTGGGVVTYTFQANRDIYNTNNAGISSSAAAINLIFNADYDQAAVQGGAIYFTGGTFSGAAVTLSGGADVNTNYAYGRAGYIEGIKLDGTVINATGAVLVRGHGYDTGSNSIGVLLQNGAKVQLAGPSNNLTMVGVGGSANSATANHGVVVTGSGTAISGASGAGISITGTQVGVTSGVYGVHVASGGSISTVNGGLTVTSNSSGSGSASIGVYVVGTGSVIESTGTGNVAVSGNPSGGSSYTIQIENAGRIGSNSGALALTGTIFNGSNNNGLYLKDGGIVRSTSGATSISMATVGASPLGLIATGTGNIIGGASSGPITLGMYGSYDFSNLTIQTSGSVTFRSYLLDANKTLAVGSGTANTVITDAGLARVTAGSYIFMTTGTTGDLTINTGFNFGDKDVSFISGQDINLAGTLTKQTGTGTATYLLQANRDIYNSGVFGIRATSGKVNIVLQADFDQATAAGGAIYLNGGVFNTGGGNITFSGGADVTTGYAYGRTGHLSGVDLEGNLTINAGAGSIVMRGYGLSGGSGIYIYGSNIGITGTGGLTATGTGLGTYGVAVAGGSQTTNSGAITINGALGMTDSGTAIYATSTGTLAVNGSVNIGGSGRIGTNGSGNVAINGNITVSGSTATISTTGTGNIILYSNSIALTGTVSSANALTIASYNGSMSVGPTTGSALNFSTALLGKISAASYVFGSLTTYDGTTANANDLTINTGYDFVDKNVTFVSGQDINIAGNLTKASGTGSAAYILQANRTIYNSNNAGISATSGIIDLTLQSDRDATSGGAISFTNGSFNSNGGTILMGGGSGSISAGTGYAAAPAATYFYGISLSGTTVNAAGGAIVLNGNANAYFIGVSLVGSTQVTTSGTGTIDIYGLGGTGSSNSAGVSIGGTVSTAGTGAITINGTSGISGGNNHGVNITGTVSGGGAVNVVGVGRATGANATNYGVYISGSGTVKTTGTGLLTVTGTGGNSAGTGGTNHGIYVSAANGINATSTGSILLNGIAGGQATSFGFNADVANAVTAGAGVVTIYADSLSLANTNAINTSGIVMIAPYTNIGMSLGAAVANTLNLSDTVLGYITGASYVFGSRTTGTGTVNNKLLTVGTSVDFVDKNLTFVSGGDINVATKLTKATGMGTVTYLFQANGNIVNPSFSQGGIIANAGKMNLILNADYDQATSPGGGIVFVDMAAVIKTNGGDVVIGGGTDPLNTAVYDSGHYGDGIYLWNASFNAGGGNITIRAKGKNSNNGGTAINLASSTTLTTSGTGAIALYGQGGDNSTNMNAIVVGYQGITAGSGGIILNGTKSSGAGTGNVGVRLSGNVTSAGGGIVITGSTTVSANVTITSGNSAITFNDTIDGDAAGTRNLTINSGTGLFTSSGIIGGTYGLKDLLITADDVAIGANISGTGALVIQPTAAGAFNISVGGAAGTYLDLNEVPRLQGGWSGITIGNGSTANTYYAAIYSSAWSSPVTFTSGYLQLMVNAALTSSNSAGVTFSKALNHGTGSSINAAGSVTYNGNVNMGASTVTAGGNITFGNTMLLYGNSTITTNSGTVTLGYTNFTTGMTAYDLTVSGQSIVFSTTTGSNNIGLRFDGATGSALKNISLTSVNSVTLPTIVAASITVNVTDATADITLPSGKTLTSGATSGPGISLTAGRDVIINSATPVSMASGGALSFSAGGATKLNTAFTYSTGGGAISFTGATVLGADVTLNSANGAVTLGGAVNGDTAGTRSLTVTAGTGTFTAGGIIGGTYTLKDLLVTATDVVLGANLYGSGILMLQPATDTTAVRINRSGAGFSLDATEISYFKEGWSQINIGRSTGTGAITVNNNNTETISFSDNVRIRSMGTTYNILGTIATTDGASLTIDGAGNLNSGSLINADGNVTFAAGSYVNSYGSTITSQHGNVSFGYISLQGHTTINAPNGTVSTLAVNMPGSMARNFTVAADTINIAGTVGNSVALAVVSLTAANSIALPSINASSISVVTTGAAADITLPTGSTLTSSATTGTGVSLAAGRDVIINSATPVSMAGGALAFSAGGATKLNTAVTYSTGGGAISFTGPVVLGADVTLNSANGAVTLGGTVNGDTDGTRSLTINAGTGTFTTGGIIGGTNKLLNLLVTADDVALGADLFGGGTLTLQPSTGVAIRVNATGAGFSLSGTEIGYLQNGWSQINIGSASLGGTITQAGTVNFNDPVRFRNSSAIYMNGTISTGDGASITFVASTVNMAAGTGKILGDGNVILTTTGWNYIYGNNTISSTLGTVSAATAFMLDGYYSQGSLTVTAAGAITLPNVARSGTPTGNLTVNGSSISFAGDIGSSVAPLAAVSLTSVNDVALPNIFASSISAQATGTAKSISIASGKTLTSTAASGSGISLTATHKVNVSSTTPFVLAGGSLNLNGTGGITLPAVTIASNGGAMSFTGNAVLSGDVTLNSANGAITFNSGVNGDAAGTHSLTVNAGTGTFTANLIGNSNPLKDLSITADDVALNGDMYGSGAFLLQPTSTTQVTLIGGSATGVTAGNLTLETAEIARIKNGWSDLTFGRTNAQGQPAMIVGTSSWSDPVTFRITTGGSTPRSISVSGVVSSTDGASITFAAYYVNLSGEINAAGDLNMATTSTRGLTVAGNSKLTSANGTITLNNIKIAGILEVDAGAGSVNMNGGVYQTESAAAGNLTVSAGTISVPNDMIGSITSGTVDPVGTAVMASVTLNSVNSIVLPTIKAQSILVKTTGANADITVASGKTLTATGTGVSLTAGRDVIINSATPVSMAGGSLNFSAGGATKLNTAVTYSTGGGAISFTGATVLGADVTLNSANGAVTMGGTVNGDAAGTRSLTVTAGTGTFTTGGIIGGSNKLKDLTITADDVVLGGAVSGSGVLTLQAATDARTIGIGTTGSQWNLDATEIGYIQNGWNSIIVGSTTGTGVQTIAGTTWHDPLTLRTAATTARNVSGALVLDDGAGFTVQGGTINLTGTITIAGDGIFSPGATVSVGLNGTNATITADGSLTFNGAVGFSGSGAKTISNHGNITFNSHANKNSGSISTISAPNGTVTFALGVNDNALSGARDLTVAANSIVFNGAIGTTTAPIAALTLTSATSITLPTIYAATLLVRTTGAVADITLGTGAVVTATGTGNALVLAAGRNFINSSGSATPFTFTGGGRWLIYSVDPANNVRGGLMPTVSQFGKTYAGSPPVTIGATGNRFLYSTGTAPTIVLTTGNRSVIYGNALTAGDLSFTYTSGLVGGDIWGSIGLTGSAGLSTSYVQGTTGYAATAYAGMINGTAGTYSSPLGYQFSFTAGDLSVAKRTLTVSLTGSISKTYDGTMDAAIGAGDFTLGNKYGSDVVSLLDTIGAYDNKNAGTGKTVTVNTLTLAGANAGNYDLAVSNVSTNSAAIGKRNLTVGGVTVTTKTYDGNTTANLNKTGATLNGFGFINGDDVVLDSSAAAGSYASANAGSGIGVTVTGFSVSGNDTGNYTFAQPTGMAGSISKKNLTAIANNQSIVYGTAVPVGEISYSGFVGSQNASVLDILPTLHSGVTGIQDVGTYAGNYTVTGGSDNNYNFSYASGQLLVTPRTLNITTANAMKSQGEADPIFSGSNNLLASDAALIAWVYAPIGYTGSVGIYTIGATATDTQNRLANYTLVTSYGTFRVRAPNTSAAVIPDSVIRVTQTPVIMITPPSTSTTIGSAWMSGWIPVYQEYEEDDAVYEEKDTPLYRHFWRDNDEEGNAATPQV